MAGTAEAPESAALAPESGTPPVPTPSGEQAATSAAPALAASKPPATVNVQALHAGFTQSRQELADIRRTLGLDSTATRQQVLDAIAAAKRPPSAETFDDPELASRYARLDEQAWGLVGRTYGEDIAGQVRHFRDVALTTGDPEELAAAFYSAVQSLGQAAAASAPAPAGGEQGQAQAPEEDIEMESPSGGLGLRQPAALPAELVGSGRTSDFFRQVFRRPSA